MSHSGSINIDGVTPERVEVLRQAFEANPARLVEHYMKVWDRLAGPGGGISADEWEFQRLCRDRFGLYDPMDFQQVQFGLGLAKLEAGVGGDPPPAAAPVSWTADRVDAVLAKLCCRDGAA